MQQKDASGRRRVLKFQSQKFGVASAANSFCVGKYSCVENEGNLTLFKHQPRLKMHAILCVRFCFQKPAFLTHSYSLVRIYRQFLKETQYQPKSFIIKYMDLRNNQ
ncbi:Hypothetical_protein [Hexamita inflata]|uniref:Hypothetical_protein n=1 Tax=Hexamita inflata TaxID=28002 RepID=A0AA86UGW8_9EUKA|nr:Hypothetical protein HINF_LOCUS27528 [Hexamita inflata]CAI9963873.1 Hypothetical protein HINF_LOCUS51518 [Hexamita inflata]